MSVSRFLSMSVKVLTILLLALGSARPVLAAPPAEFNRAAIVVRFDGGCSWQSISSTGEGVLAVGSTQGVLTSTGSWKLSCAGEIVYQTFPLTEAIVLHSTDEAPLGTCFADTMITQNFMMVFSPSGESHFTCWGQLP
jgi:hypothetical protein